MKGHWGFRGNARLLQDEIKGTHQAWCFVISRHQSGALVAAMLPGSQEKITHTCVYMSMHTHTHKHHTEVKSSKGDIRTSLAVQWLRLSASTAGGTVLIPGRGTKIPHATRHRQKKKKRGVMSQKHE